MARPRTTLVLGAGASVAYGFPLGTDLRRRIIHIGSEGDISNSLGMGTRSIREFADVFHRAGSFSIDFFLGRRLQYEEIGKRAIAYVISSCEKQANLFAEEGDQWYQYLTNLLAAESWTEFDPSWLSIVTFNYDRSLEVYLAESLRHTYGKTTSEIVARLKSMQIVHVYGSLGSPWEGAADHMPFSLPDELRSEFIPQAASRIQVIPEGRNDSATIVEARRLLLEAERICFLGFGFDETNVERLGAPAFMQNASNKRLVGTRRGLTDARVSRIASKLFGKDVLLAPSLMSLNCWPLLQETLILE